MRKTVRVIQITLLAVCWLSHESRAESSDFEGVAEAPLVFLVAVITVPTSAAFIIVNLGELANDDPDMKIATWGLGFGLVATWSSLKLVQYGDSDSQGVIYAAAAVGATCTVLSAINMYRASRTNNSLKTMSQIEPAIWSDLHGKTVLGIQVQKSF